MHTFDCQDGLTFFYHSDLTEVIIQDEEGYEVRNYDFREFLNFVRAQDLAEDGLRRGVFLGQQNTLFRYSDHLHEVILEDAKGNQIQCQNFKDFADLIRTRDLEVALEDSGLNKVL